MKQYMPKKPTKRGFKVWVRGDSSNGYVYKPISASLLYPVHAIDKYVCITSYMYVSDNCSLMLIFIVKFYLVHLLAIFQVEDIQLSDSIMANPYVKLQ